MGRIGVRVRAEEEFGVPNVVEYLYRRTSVFQHNTQCASHKGPFRFIVYLSQAPKSWTSFNIQIINHNTCTSKSHRSSLRTPR